jgi:hypothetical protein
MSRDTEVAGYLSEIRRQVCSLSIERSPGSSPCLPLRRQCAIELHLLALVEAARVMDSPLMKPCIDPMASRCVPRARKGIRKAALARLSACECC